MSGIHQAGKDFVAIKFECNKCEAPSFLQVNFTKDTPIQEGYQPFPDDARFACPHCNAHHNLSEMKQDLEIAFLERIKRAP